MRLGIFLWCVCAAPTAAQSASDSAAIRAAALDYVDGWYEGSANRMARALHPELVKRIVVNDTTTGKSVLQNMGASALVNGTRHGYGNGRWAIVNVLWERKPAESRDSR
jgi:hypothetical protein